MSASESTPKTPRLRRCCLAGVVLYVISHSGNFWHSGQQQASIGEVERRGGYVWTDYGGPDWLRALIGSKRMKLFDPVLGIHFKGSQITDTGLSHLSGLTTLEWLELGNTQVSDQGLRYLNGLSNLYWLDVGSTQITDEGLTHLIGLKNLKLLHLDNRGQDD